MGKAHDKIEANRKARLARDAPDEMNSVPGSHGPVDPASAAIMKAMLNAVREAFPGKDLCIFVFDTETGRYNYGATVDRADMNAVLRGHLARQGEMMAIDAGMDEPAKGSA